MKRPIKIALLSLLGLPVLFAAFAWYTLQPKEQNLALPPTLISAETPDGMALLDTSEHKADFGALDEAYVAQDNISYCGVASGVAVLKALGIPSSQSDFFTDAASKVRSRLQVTFGGMTLQQLDGLLAAHGLETRLVHGDDIDVDEFRSLLAQNLSKTGDYLLVNYQREDLGQGRSGHISPVGAYNADADRVLIMDTADFKYPHTWVPLELLHKALLEVDSASERPRGLLEVTL